MNVIRRRGWELPESQVTPERLFFNRRSFMAGAAGTMASILSPSLSSAQRLNDVADAARSDRRSLSGEGQHHLSRGPRH